MLLHDFFPPFPRSMPSTLQTRILGITLRPNEEAPLVFFTDRDVGVRIEGYEATSPVLLLQVAAPEHILTAPFQFGGPEQSFSERLMDWEGRVAAEMRKIQERQVFQQMWDALRHHPFPQTQEQYDKEARAEAEAIVGPKPEPPRWPLLCVKKGGRLAFSLRNLVDAPTGVAIHTLVQELGADA